MKRILILAIIAALLTAPLAAAQTPSEMQVINCNEWVSLRAEPDSNAQRFAEVPLGETVYGFYASNGDFTQCSYRGSLGYILNQYLEVVSEGGAVKHDPAAEPDQRIPMEGGCIAIWKGYHDDDAKDLYSETMYIARLDENGNEIWSHSSESLAAFELSSVDAFVNAPANQVMVYNGYYGLTALDAETGAEKWTIGCDTVSLGGDIRYAVAEDGSMYIGGYYGPDPVGISADGRVLFESSCLHEDPYLGETDFCWMDRVEVHADELIAHYRNVEEPPVTVHYDFSGNMLSWEEEPYEMPE